MIDLDDAALLLRIPHHGHSRLGKGGDLGAERRDPDLREGVAAAELHELFAQPGDLVGMRLGLGLEDDELLGEAGRLITRGLG